jgi:hypothetical protein
VIEQVASPLEFLNQAADRLKPNGLIVIRTGNARSWKFDRDRNRWLWFGLTRRAYFSPRSLREALSTSGFRSIDVIDCESTERPGWQPAPDISQTPLAEGVRALTRSPAKLAKAGLYLKYLVRRMKGRWRHGRHYQTSVMTAVAMRAQGAA